MNNKSRKPYNSQSNLNYSNNSKNHLNKKEKLPLQNHSNQKFTKPIQNNNIKNTNLKVNSNQKKDVIKDKPNNEPNCWEKTKNTIVNFVKEIWGNKLKRYIALGIIGGILLIVIIIIIVVCATKSSDSKNDDQYYDDNDIIIFPSKSYSNIPTSTEAELRTSLNSLRLSLTDNQINFAVKAIKRHNTLRSYHNAGPLRFNKDLMQKAQTFANSDTIPLEHSPNFNSYGENLYWYGNIQISGDYPVDEWYKEFSKYDFKTGKSKGGVISHFTQIVWKETEEFGIGYNCKGTNCIVVANYSPKGNIEGQYLNQIQDYIK